jgi:hypothetical protein
MKQVMDTLTTPEDLAAQSSGGSKFKITHLVAPTDFSPNSERAVDEFDGVGTFQIWGLGSNGT